MRLEFAGDEFPERGLADAVPSDQARPLLAKAEIEIGKDGAAIRRDSVMDDMMEPC